MKGLYQAHFAVTGILFHVFQTWAAAAQAAAV